MLYVVTVREVNTYRVCAGSPEEAEKEWAKGNAEWLDTEESDILEVYSDD